MSIDSGFRSAWLKAGRALAGDMLQAVRKESYTGAARALKEPLCAFQDALTPWHAMRHSAWPAEFLFVVKVPLIVPEQRVFVGVLRSKARFVFSFFDGHE